MKKQYLIVATTLLLATLAVVCLTDSNELVLASYQNSSEIKEGTVTIGQGGNNLKNESGTSNFKSSNNNSFSFTYSGISKNNDSYTLTSASSIKNNNALHGIYRIDIFNPNTSGRGYVYSGFESATEDYTYLNINSSVVTYTFDSNKPNYIEIKGMNSYPLVFTKIIIYYSCQEGSHYYYNFSQGKYNGLNLSSDYRDVIVSEFGNYISDIDTDYFVFYRTYSRKPANEVTNISIQYVEDELKNTTTVVEGAHPVNITYQYNGYTYMNSKPILLYGYNHCQSDYSYAYLNQTKIKAQNNDIIPDGLMYKIQTLDLCFYDSNDNQLVYLSFSTDLEPLSETTFTTSDAHPFSTVGDKTITITKLGIDISINYIVYDPEINNIEEIFTDEHIVVPRQSTRNTFLKLVETIVFRVYYFEDNWDLPSEITGNAITFMVDDSTFDVDYSSSLEISFSYSTYVGTITVELIEPDGELINYYTSYTGVASLVVQQVIKRVEVYEHRVKLFDNVSGVGLPHIEDQWYSYSSTQLIYGMHQLILSLDGNNHTFWSYQGQSLYENLTVFDDGYNNFTRVDFFKDGYAKFYTSEGYILYSQYGLNSNMVHLNYWLMGTSDSGIIDPINKTFTFN